MHLSRTLALLIVLCTSVSIAAPIQLEKRQTDVECSGGGSASASVNGVARECGQGAQQGTTVQGQGSNTGSQGITGSIEGTSGGAGSANPDHTATAGSGGVEGQGGSSPSARIREMGYAICVKAGGSCGAWKNL